MKTDKEGQTIYEDGDECHIISNIGKPTVIFRFLCGKWVKVIDDPKPDEFHALNKENIDLWLAAIPRGEYKPK